MTAGVVGGLLVTVAGGDRVGLLVIATLPIGLTAMAMPALTATAMTGAPRHQIGAVSGALNTARQTGGALGVAVLGALLHTGAHVSLRPVFGTIAVAYGIGVGLAVTGWRGRR